MVMLTRAESAARKKPYHQCDQPACENGAAQHNPKTGTNVGGSNLCQTRLGYSHRARGFFRRKERIKMFQLDLQSGLAACNMCRTTSAGGLLATCTTTVGQYLVAIKMNVAQLEHAGPTKAKAAVFGGSGSEPTTRHMPRGDTVQLPIYCIHQC